MKPIHYLPVLGLWVASPSQAVLIFTSDVENDGSWVGNSGWSTNNFPGVQPGGLLNPYPQAGSGAFVVNGGQFRTADTGQTVEAGTYLYTARIGNWSNAPFHDQPVAFNIRAGGTNFNLDPYETAATKPAPASGAWETWSVTYEVPAGAPEIGEPLIAVYWAAGATGSTNSAFDGPLSVDFTPIPEPSSAVLALAGLAAVGRRRRP